MVVIFFAYCMASMGCACAYTCDCSCSYGYGCDCASSSIGLVVVVARKKAFSSDGEHNMELRGVEPIPPPTNLMSLLHLEAFPMHNNYNQN